MATLLTFNHGSKETEPRKKSGCKLNNGLLRCFGYRHHLFFKPIKYNFVIAHIFI